MKSNKIYIFIIVALILVCAILGTYCFVLNGQLHEQKDKFEVSIGGGSGSSNSQVTITPNQKGEFEVSIEGGSSNSNSQVTITPTDE